MVSERLVTDSVSVSGTAVEDTVEIRLPADSAYLSVLRTATAGLAARLDFTLDEIEDLRIAVDEACAMLLPAAIDTATLTCRFRLDPTTLEVVASIAVGTSPHSLAVHPTRPLVANVNYDSASVSMTDTTTNTVVATIDVPANQIGRAHV